MCGGELDGLVVQLGLQLLVLRHLPHRLHEVLVNHVLPLRSAIQDIGLFISKYKASLSGMFCQQIKRLWRGHLQPKLEVLRLDMSRTGTELEPSWWEASTPEKSNSNSLLIAIRNTYIWATNHWRMLVTWTPPPPPVHVLHELTRTHMNCTRM